MAKKAAIITGSASGIGRAITQRIADDGFDIIASDINKKGLHEVVKEIMQSKSQKVIAFTLDVKIEKDVKAMFKKCIDEFGRLDVLITAAGIAQVNTLEELTEEIWDKTVDINLKGTFFCMLEAAKIMREQKFGKIITIASDFAIEGARYHVCYSASKFGVRGLTQAFAKELAPYNVNVNTIAPGIIWTPMWKESDEKLSRIFRIEKGKAFETFTKQLVKLPRTGKPEYIAPVASFLASEDSDYITAATIPVGGGSIIL